MTDNFFVQNLPVVFSIAVGRRKEIINMKNNLIKIGQVKIDSGSLLLCDPRQTTQGIDFMQTAFSFLGIGDRYQVGNGTGVLVPTQVNGTTCDIEALVEETLDNKQVITGINVRFINPDIDMPVWDDSKEQSLLI